MINMAFLLFACVANKNINYKDTTAVTLPHGEQWTCKDFSWTSTTSEPTSIVRIKTNDCNSDAVTAVVNKHDGSHRHYTLNHDKGCEWNIMIMLEQTVCRQISNVKILQQAR